jgi:hypothetical protein
MPPKVRKNAEFLQRVYKGPVRVRKELISKANDEQVKTLCECALNVCQGRVKTSAKDLRRLKAKENNLIRLAYAPDSVETKRKLLIQSGGALPILASLGLTALSSLLPSIFGR